MILNPPANLDRNRIFAALRSAGIGFRMITGGCFLRHDAIRYFDYDVVDGGVPNAELAHDSGFFVGNAPFDLSSEITCLREVLDRAAGSSQRA
jgi:CDP-6-deoxy-D-xylo-4-hexulose-3-dehydrase